MTLATIAGACSGSANTARRKATNSAPLLATVSTDSGSVPPMTMQGIFDHRRPPLGQRHVLRMRFRLDIAIDLAEKHIIRADLTHLQSMMTIGGIAAADDQLG